MNAYRVGTIKRARRSNREVETLNAQIIDVLREGHLQYALIDRRTNGKARTMADYHDPAAARSAADLLRWAGDATELFW